jgi:hypothetical protein
MSSDHLPLYAQVENVIMNASPTIQVSKDPVLGGRPSNILRQSLDRNRAQQGRMAGLGQLELAVLP